MWFAFKLVSLNHWKQLFPIENCYKNVVICFQISIFEPLETTLQLRNIRILLLWFAFKLVSLNHWKQHKNQDCHRWKVVICFQISIFEPLETTQFIKGTCSLSLWFAFKLVSLNHWKQLMNSNKLICLVVICFQISIFEPLETTRHFTSWGW